MLLATKKHLLPLIAGLLLLVSWLHDVDSCGGGKGCGGGGYKGGCGKKDKCGGYGKKDKCGGYEKKGKCGMPYKGGGGHCDGGSCKMSASWVGYSTKSGTEGEGFMKKFVKAAAPHVGSMVGRSIGALGGSSSRDDEPLVERRTTGIYNARPNVYRAPVEVRYVEVPVYVSRESPPINPHDYQPDLTRHSYSQRAAPIYRRQQAPLPVSNKREPYLYYDAPPLDRTRYSRLTTTRNNPYEVASFDPYEERPYYDYRYY